MRGLASLLLLACAFAVQAEEATRARTGVVSEVSRRKFVLDERLHIGFVGDDAVLRGLDNIKAGDRVLAIFGSVPRPGGGRINKLLSIRSCADVDAECDAARAQQEAEDKARDEAYAVIEQEHQRCLGLMRDTLAKDPRHVPPHAIDVPGSDAMDRLNALFGEEKTCADKVIKDHLDAEYEACELHHCGDRIGGGCFHIRGYAMNTHLFEVAVAKCGD